MSKKLFYALPTLLTAVAMLAANELAANNPPENMKYLQPLIPAKEKIVSKDSAPVLDWSTIIMELYAKSSPAEQTQYKHIYNVITDAMTHKIALPTNGRKILHYSVPALSNLQRLPNKYPSDGEFEGEIKVVMAQDEYEPASILLFAPNDLPQVQLTASALKNADGNVIPAADIDLKVVKVWYQNSNGWYNYFGDFSRKLLPELLLNDERLIQVDTKTKDNYLRVKYPQGEKYIWISAPEQIDPGFDADKEPVYDADSLQPITLNAGEFKQIFITIHAEKETKPGLYQGKITLSEGNAILKEIPLSVRVLPFILPQPKTYYDITADFYTMLYCVPGPDGYYSYNGRNRRLSNEKTLKRFINQRKHNVNNPLYLGLWKGYDGYDNVVNSINLAKKAGMVLDPFFEAFGCGATFGNTEQFLRNKRNAEVAKKAFKELLGHTNLWPAGGEEPGYSRIVGAREDWQMVHELGMNVMCNGGDRRHYSGYADQFRIGGGFANAEESKFMHEIGGKIGNYAGPHTGPENPDYMRRMHGMNLYKKNYDMMYNYGYHEGGWNDFHTDTYRGMNLIYYTYNGIIDTLAWEGIREGIDDIRYATKLKMLAQQAIATQETDKVYAGRKALQFMALLNENNADLDAARSEMINHIMQLNNLLQK